MKVLVYGAGVIGGQLCHVLCRCGNDVTVLARGTWADTLENDGLQIYHYVQRKHTTDHPRVIRKTDDQRYDIVFAVMQYRQMETVLSDLAKINSPIVVLTGNDLSVSDMESKILAESGSPKTVLFGFGSTAGTREHGKLTTVHAGDGKLTIGKADSAVAGETKQVIRKAFTGSRLTLSWCDNMDAWLKYHAAFILPVVYLCYKTDCDLSKAGRSDRKLLLDAAGDAYRMLMDMGYPVRPQGDEKSFEPGLMNLAVKAVIYLVTKTRIGALCTSEHCRHAPKEMKDLHEGFMRIRERNPGFKMPSFDRLYEMMPSWDRILEQYAAKEGPEREIKRK